ncbi:MAG: pilus assembly protein [Alphaproteobacteria bacterium]|nr:pilus assembly protein [Alphaproteobacteria bacterium]
MRLRRRQERRGAIAVEFALTMPLLLVLIAAIIDFGWYFNQQMMLLHSVREGARTGATTSQDGDPLGDAEARVSAALMEAGLDASAATVTASFSGTAPQELITVSATLPFQPIVTLVPLPVSLNGELTMRMEDQPD